MGMGMGTTRQGGCIAVTVPAMTPTQRAEYIRLSFATVDTLKAAHEARRAPTLSPERLDRLTSIYRANKAVV